MLWLFFSCTPLQPYDTKEPTEELEPSEGARSLQLVYGTNMDGEIEPCG